MTFTPSHRGGSGPPLVLLHGFLDTWHTWELVLPALQRRREVLAVTLAGHAGGPALEGSPGAPELADAVERAMDAAGFASAHLAGNSLGGYLALLLAERGRARSVVALAPAGGWAAGDESFHELLALQARLHEQARAVAPQAGRVLATPEGRRRATQYIVANCEHLPAELLARLMLGVAACPAADRLLAAARHADWSLDPARITCPVRVVWGTADRLLPWPSSAARYRTDWLPHADWIELEGIGHCPQLDTPLETAELIHGFV